ncbi:MAG: ATP-grasp domain-containing protein [Gemmatimonadota bacterium]
MSLVLIAGTPGPAELSAARALWRDGDVCDLIWERPLGARSWSRSVRRWHASRPAFADPLGYMADVRDRVAGDGHDVVLPYGLPAYYAAVHHRHLLEGKAASLLPSVESFRIANDKASTGELCRDLGISVPRSFTPEDEGDVRALAREARFPLIVKPRSGSATGLRVVQTADELLAAVQTLMQRRARGAAERFEAPLVQEFISGHLHDACAVWHDARPLATLTQVRQVMVPVYGGVGAVNVTTDNPTVRELAHRVLGALQWSGPAQVEFRHDPRSGEYHLIEINPKFWGTLALSIHAGLNFPVLAREAALGRVPTREPTYRVGVRRRFTFPRAREASLQLKALLGRSAATVPGGTAASYGDIDWLDPVPDLMRVREWQRGRGEAQRRAMELDSALRPLITPPEQPWAGLGKGRARAL